MKNVTTMMSDAPKSETYIFNAVEKLNSAEYALKVADTSRSAGAEYRGEMLEPAIERMEKAIRETKKAIQALHKGE